MGVDVGYSIVLYAEGRRLIVISKYKIVVYMRNFFQYSLNTFIYRKLFIALLKF